MTDLFEATETWVLNAAGHYGRDPAVCADATGRLWSAWISWEPEGECVRACWKDPGAEWSAPIACGPHRPIITSLDAAPWRDGALVTWVDGGDPEADGLKLARIGEGKAAPARLVSPWRRSPDGPALCSHGGRFMLAWSSSSPGGRRIEVLCGADPAESFETRTLSHGAGSNVSPAVAMLGDEAWCAWQMCNGDRVSILATRCGLDGEPIGERISVAGGGGGIPAMPALAATGKGAWIAWQSDLDPDRGPGLVRWIELARIDRGDRLEVPESPMPGVARNTSDQDQGFESPTLVINPDGSVAIIGRGSQSLRRQDLGRDGWTDRGRIDDDGWKCRSPRYTACSCEEGILVAGREKDGITVRLVPHGEGSGSPTTVPVDRPARPAPEARDEGEPGLEIAGRRFYFGDIHQHTAASDGTGTATETFLRARLRYGDEICAVADHESFLGKRTPPGEWGRLCAIADEHMVPGRFVTLHAFEWTGKMHPGPGHKVGYLPPRGGPCLSRDDEATSTSAGLSYTARKLGALVFPHHVGWTGADMDNHDPRVQTCWEIVSAHGAYERMGWSPIGTRGDDKEGQFAIDALNNGLRFGFVGGSDGHGLAWHHGVCRMEDSHRSGLTAVFCESLTREGVFEALRNRRCYATSGAKIGLWFEVAGLPMGEEIPVTESVSFRIAVRATAEIESLCLVTNEGREITLESGGASIEARGTLPAPPEGHWAYFFARVVQVDGHVAWSSPIWLDAPGSPGSGLPAA